MNKDVNSQECETRGNSYDMTVGDAVISSIVMCRSAVASYITTGVEHLGC